VPTNRAEIVSVIRIVVNGIPALIGFCAFVARPQGQPMPIFESNKITLAYNYLNSKENPVKTRPANNCASAG
jgi:hypothetical protein